MYTVKYDMIYAQYRQMDRQTVRQTGGQSNRQIGRQTDRQKGHSYYKEINRQTDRQTATIHNIQYLAEYSNNP